MSYLDLCKDIKYQVFLRLPMSEVRKHSIKFDYDFMAQWVKIYSKYFLMSSIEENLTLEDTTSGSLNDLCWPVVLTNLKGCPIKYQNSVNKMLATYEFLLHRSTMDQPRIRGNYKKYIEKWKHYQHDFEALFRHFDSGSDREDKIRNTHQFKQFFDLVLYYYKRENMLMGIKSGKFGLHSEHLDALLYPEHLMDDELVPLIKDYYDYLFLVRLSYPRYDNLTSSCWRHLKIAIEGNLVKTIDISGLNYCLQHNIVFKQLLPLIWFQGSHAETHLVNILTGSEFRCLSEEDHRSFIKRVIMDVDEIFVSNLFYQMVARSEHNKIAFNIVKMMTEEVPAIDILFVSPNMENVFGHRMVDELIDFLYARGFRFLFYPEIMSVVIKNKKILPKCYKMVLEEQEDFRKMQVLLRSTYRH